MTSIAPLVRTVPNGPAAVHTEARLLPQPVSLDRGLLQVPGRNTRIGAWSSGWTTLSGPATALRAQYGWLMSCDTAWSHRTGRHPAPPTRTYVCTLCALSGLWIGHECIPADPRCWRIVHLWVQESVYSSHRRGRSDICCVFGTTCRQRITSWCDPGLRVTKRVLGLYIQCWAAHGPLHTSCVTPGELYIVYTTLME
jgi:hypothetical protein